MNRFLINRLSLGCARSRTLTLSFVGTGHELRLDLHTSAQRPLGIFAATRCGLMRYNIAVSPLATLTWGRRSGLRAKPGPLVFPDMIGFMKSRAPSESAAARDSRSANTSALPVSATNAFPEITFLSNAEIAELRPHPALGNLPPLTTVQKHAQESSIRKHGVLKPILIREKLVLDGWHLLHSALAAGVRPFFLRILNDYNHDADDLSIDLNLATRGLDISQRAMIGAMIVKKSPSSVTGSKVSARKIAPQVCASASYINRAVILLGKDPASANLVRIGELRLPEAERKVREAESCAQRTAHARLNPAPREWITLHPGRFQDTLSSVGSDTAAAIITDPLYNRGARQDWIDLGALAQAKLRPGGALVVMVGDETMLDMADAVREGGGKELRFWRQITIRFHGRLNSEEGILTKTRKVLVFYKTGGKKHRPTTNEFPCDLIEDVRGADTVAHPYAQRVEMFEHFVRWFSAPGDLVLEPFAGGGTIVAACAKLGRRCIAAERDTEAYERMHLCLFGDSSALQAEPSRPVAEGPAASQPALASPGENVQASDQPHIATPIQETCLKTADEHVVGRQEEPRPSSGKRQPLEIAGAEMSLTSYKGHPSQRAQVVPFDRRRPPRGKSGGESAKSQSATRFHGEVSPPPEVGRVCGDKSNPQDLVMNVSN